MKLNQPDRDKMEKDCRVNRWSVSQLKQKIWARHGKHKSGDRPFAGHCRGQVGHRQFLADVRMASEVWIRTYRQVWGGQTATWKTDGLEFLDEMAEAIRCLRGKIAESNS